MKPPVMLYDDKCHICIGFARVVNRLAKGRLTIVGHYTKEGRRLRETHLYPEATEMFWILDEREAYGGRAALPQLLRCIISARGGVGLQMSNVECSSEGCDVLARSTSLITNSDYIKYDTQRHIL